MSQTQSASFTIDQRWEAFRKYRKESERQLLIKPQKTEADVKSEKNDLECSDQLLAAEWRRSLPLELLAGEWLKEQCGEAATTTYMMDRLLPTLILGIEKLMTEVHEYT